MEDPKPSSSNSNNNNNNNNNKTDDDDENEGPLGFFIERAYVVTSQSHATKVAVHCFTHTEENAWNAVLDFAEAYFIRKTPNYEPPREKDDPAIPHFSMPSPSILTVLNDPRGGYVTDDSATEPRSTWTYRWWIRRGKDGKSVEMFKRGYPMGHCRVFRYHCVPGYIRDAIACGTSWEEELNRSHEQTMRLLEATSVVDNDGSNNDSDNSSSSSDDDDDDDDDGAATTTKTG
jgi:hypothetical protein